MAGTRKRVIPSDGMLGCFSLLATEARARPCPALGLVLAARALRTVRFSGEHAGTRRHKRATPSRSASPARIARPSRAAYETRALWLIWTLPLWARGRGVSVDTYRDLFKEQRTRPGSRSRKALQVINDLDKMPPDEFKVLAESLVMLSEEAARYGMSVSSLAEITLDYADGESPA